MLLDTSRATRLRSGYLQTYCQIGEGDSSAFVKHRPRLRFVSVDEAIRRVAEQKKHQAQSTGVNDAMPSAVLKCIQL